MSGDLYMTSVHSALEGGGILCCVDDHLLEHLALLLHEVARLCHHIQVHDDLQPHIQGITCITPFGL